MPKYNPKEEYPGQVYKGAYVRYAMWSNDPGYLKGLLIARSCQMQKETFKSTMLSKLNTTSGPPASLNLLKRAAFKDPRSQIVADLEEAFYKLTGKDYEMSKGVNGGVFIDTSTVAKDATDICKNFITFYNALSQLSNGGLTSASSVLTALELSDTTAVKGLQTNNILYNYARHGDLSGKTPAQIAQIIQNKFEHYSHGYSQKMGFLAEDLVAILFNDPGVQEMIKEELGGKIADLFNRGATATRLGESATAFNATIRATYDPDKRTYHGGGKPLADINIQAHDHGATISIKDNVNVSVKHHKIRNTIVKLGEISYSSLYKTPTLSPPDRMYLYRAIVDDDSLREGYGYYLAANYSNQVLKDATYGGGKRGESYTEYIVDNYKLMKLDDYAARYQNGLGAEFGKSVYSSGGKAITRSSNELKELQKNRKATWWSGAASWPQAKENIDLLHKLKLYVYIDTGIAGQRIKDIEINK